MKVKKLIAVRKFSFALIMLLIGQSMVHAQILDGLFSESPVERAKHRKARIEKSRNNVKAQDKGSATVTDAVRREKQTERMEADVKLIDEGTSFERYE